MSGINDLMGVITPGLFQQAYVVSDLAEAEAAMQASLGCSAFVDLPATDLDYELRGERASCALALGFARSGDVQIELLQPMRGAGLHIEFLASNGPGAHHFGFLVDDLAATVELGVSCGAPLVMGGEFGRLRFGYLDTWDALGIYTEVVEDPDAMMWNLMPWRDHALTTGAETTG